MQVAHTWHRMDVRATGAKLLHVVRGRLLAADCDDRSDVGAREIERRTNRGHLIPTRSAGWANPHRRAGSGADAAAHTERRIDASHQCGAIILARHHRDRIPRTVLRALI